MTKKKEKVKVTMPVQHKRVQTAEGKRRAQLMEHKSLKRKAA